MTSPRGLCWPTRATSPGSSAFSVLATARRLVRAMRSRRLHALAGSALAVGAVSMISASPAKSAAPPRVRDSKAPYVLQHSAWARQNGVTTADCTGIGPARKAALRKEHTAFRCRVWVGRNPAGVVVATALGPEWLRITRIVEGKLEPDRGIGPIPNGRPILESFWAGSALENSSWATRNRIETAFCYGVGRFRQYEEDGWLFFAYSCSTFDVNGRRAAQVLVVATGSKSVRVVRTLAR